MQKLTLFILRKSETSQTQPAEFWLIRDFYKQLSSGWTSPAVWLRPRLREQCQLGSGSRYDAARLSGMQADSGRLVKLFLLLYKQSLRGSQTHPGTIPPASHLLPGYHLTVASTVGCDLKVLQ